jgi:TonB family protein
MFDKLIESNSAEAAFKPRRKFFMVSSVVVGILFLSAVVFSLYAQDIDLGTDDFELSIVVAPVAPDAPEPEPPRTQPEQNRSNAPLSEAPMRRTNMARVDETAHVPDTISTTPNSEWARPDVPFRLGDIDSGTGRTDAPIGAATGTTSAGPGESTVAIEEKRELPPPPKIEPPKRTTSIGVVNGKATYLPKPPYPQTAIAVRAEGEVTVQVTIDEQGKVIAAKALRGHPLLKGVSEKAAWSARFSPTLLSKVPVKVTGVIVYKFSRG